MEHVTDPGHWIGTTTRFLGSLVAGVQDLKTQGHCQRTNRERGEVFSTDLQATQPFSVYECVFWLHGRQAFRPQSRHSKMNQCPVELQKEQFHWSRLVSDLMLFQEVWLQGIAKDGDVDDSSDRRLLQETNFR